MGDRGGLGGRPNRIDDLRRRVQHRQRARACRVCRVVIHRQRVLRPHLAICGLGGRDCRRILTEEVGGGQCCQLDPVGGHHRWWHGHCQGGLVGSHGQRGLAGGLAGLGGHHGRPRHIRPEGRCHGERCRSQPAATGESRDHRLVVARGGLQFGGQARPVRRGRRQRSGAGPGVDPRGVDLRRQGAKVNHFMPQFVAAGCDSNREAASSGAGGAAGFVMVVMA